MKISVIIPVYNALEDVKILFESLNKYFNFQLGDITIINDYSREETTFFLNDFVSKNANYKLINNEENLGFIKTCNKGMQIADGDVVVLLNSDTKITSGFCEKIVKCFNTDSNIATASPMADGCYYSVPKPKNWSLEKMNLVLNRRHKCCYPIIPEAEGYCYCIRKEVIEKQGFFDEIYGKGYNDEVDYSFRAITNGWKNVLIDDLYIYHKNSASFGVKNTEELKKQNDVPFKARWGNFRQEYINKINWVDPTFAIEKELFPMKFICRNIRHFVQNIFSVKNSHNKTHKIIKILGISVSIKRKSI